MSNGICYVIGFIAAFVLAMFPMWALLDKLEQQRRNVTALLSTIDELRMDLRRALDREKARAA